MSESTVDEDVEVDLEDFSSSAKKESSPADTVTKKKAPKKKAPKASLKKACCTRVCCALGILILVVTGVVLALYFLVFQDDTTVDPIASCGDCHCIPAGGAADNETCPTDKPETAYPSGMADILETQIPLNFYTFDCDPYCNDCECQTEPAQEFLEEEGAVCGIHYDLSEEDTDGSLACIGASYHLQSYASAQAAEVAGAFVTHVGPCGVCSTTKDLAAYLKSPDLTTDGKICGKKGVFSFNEAVDCYMDLGFTRPCAEIWSYNGQNTAKRCLTECIPNFNKPNNGPAPQCELNDCLQCDEEKSGPMFQQFAGRTRRASGLLSAIARPCDDLVPLVQEACPQTKPLFDKRARKDRI